MRLSLDLTNDKSTLVQVMAWCHQTTSHYLSQCWPRSLSPYGVTWPQWVNMHEDEGQFSPYAVQSEKVKTTLQFLWISAKSWSRVIILQLSCKFGESAQNTYWVNKLTWHFNDISRQCLVIHVIYLQYWVKHHGRSTFDVICMTVVSQYTHWIINMALIHLCLSAIRAWLTLCWEKHELLSIIFICWCAHDTHTHVGARARRTHACTHTQIYLRSKVVAFTCGEIMSEVAFIVQNNYCMLTWHWHHNCISILVTKCI